MIHRTFLDSRRGILLTAVIAVLGPVVFLVGEAVAARAWTAGSYNYGLNFISDLGTTVCESVYGGREMCSPLHGVMNFSFVAMGVLVAAAATLLAARFDGPRRVIGSLLGWSISFGMILVATFHGGAESAADGTIVFHGLGAVIAIMIGNTLAIFFGVNTHRLSFSGWYRPAVTTTGVIGIVAGILTLVDPPFWEPAIFERTAVYAIFAWLFLSAANLVVLARAEKNRCAVASRQAHFVRY